MTDREMIFYAARAAGVVHPEVLRTHLASGWNPIADDGDAFRLAVMLGIDLQFSAGATWVELDAVVLHHEFDKDDPYAATRRAIVRAAAEIGRNMKS